MVAAATEESRIAHEVLVAKFLQTLLFKRGEKKGGGEVTVNDIHDENIQHSS